MDSEKECLIFHKFKGNRIDLKKCFCYNTGNE